MKKDIERQILELSEEVQRLRERVDTISYSLISSDAISKYMILNQNQLLTDMSLLHGALKAITDSIAVVPGTAEAEDNDESLDESSDFGDDEDEEPNTSLN